VTDVRPPQPAEVSPESVEGAVLGSSKGHPEGLRRAQPASGSGHHNVNRQSVLYCPYCGEETLFPAERGWECRSCLRAFSVSFLGLVPRERAR
jgi:hypothetical protein